ncbi:MAG TPA: NADH-quinone oxidoreductase subunit A [Caulobacteraceae bacterium]|nr:NADH-quinone oxidoreductase subunit A [Caulobacteraceae bacterium]
MDAFLLQYLPIVIFLAVAAALGIGFMLAAAVIAPRAPDAEKLSSYECGFNAFGDARMKFDIRFYLVSILFIIFDLEVAFMFPWAVALMKLPHAAGQFAFWSMMSFLTVLTVGFVYEWKKGALEWE